LAASGRANSKIHYLANQNPTHKLCVGLVIITDLIADQSDIYQITSGESNSPSDSYYYLWKVGPYKGKLFRVPVTEAVSAAVVPLL